MKMKEVHLKIFVVDDDAQFVEAFAERFRKVGSYTTTMDTASTGAEMLEKIYFQSYDLIFLDLDLPDMDGVEILSRVGQTTLPLPIVMMAGKSDARLAVEAMKRGVLDFILKEDLLPADLPLLVRRLLTLFRMRRENAELQQINQMKNDFLATISHELRTPLTSILGLSEVLMSGRLGPLQAKQGESLKKILDQSHNLVRLIDQLLDIRALTQESMKMDMRSISLKDSLRKRVEAIHPLFQEKNVSLVFTAPDQDMSVEADELNLAKVMEHLLTNALKFTPSGGSVRVELKDVDRFHAQFKISDTGRGIPPEALTYVFQKFFHVDQTLTRPYGGMGLGLAFCKEVVEAHGGRIWVESQGENQGTLVSFVIPKTQKTSAAARESGIKKSILWVDDNPNMLELIEYGFASFPHSITLHTAQSGAAALEKIKNEPPHLIVLDVMMADMDGLEVLTRLKNDPVTADIPILIVTGYQESARAAMGRGASDFCLKPFRIPEILQKIEGLLSTSPNRKLAESRPSHDS
jgi:signal transduction histidine kinase